MLKAKENSIDEIGVLMKELILISVTHMNSKTNTVKWFAIIKWGFASSTSDLVMTEKLKLNSDEDSRLELTLISHENVRKCLSNSKTHDFEEKN